MRAKLSTTLVGLFVLGGAALIVAGLLSLRSCHPFSKPGRFVSYFHESVQGLDVGGTVRLRGVRVGRVVAIQVNYDSVTHKSQIQVVSELDKNVMTDRAGKTISLADPTTLETLITEGLRAKIALVGITGIQFLQLDFLDPKQFPTPAPRVGSVPPEIPTVSSGMSELMANLSKVVGELNKVPFSDIARNFQTLLATANRTIGDADLKNMVSKISQAAESIQKLAGSPEAAALFSHLNESAVAVQGLANKLNTQVEPAREELVRTLSSFRAAAEEIHKFLASSQGLSDETIRALQSVSEAARSLEQLTDLLERNPSVLLKGKRYP